MSAGEKRGFWGRSKSAPAAVPEPAPGTKPGDGFALLFGGPATAPAHAAREIAPLRESPDPHEPPPSPGSRASVSAPVSDPARPAFARPRRVPAPAYTAPEDLADTTLPPYRILAIGSCFLSNMMHQAPGELKPDVLVVNAITDFPAAPPREVSSYDVQLIQVPLRAVIRDDHFARISYDDEPGYAAAFEVSCAELRLHLEARLRWNRAHGTLAFVMNFPEPQFAMMGRLQPRFDLRDPGTFVRRLNEELEAIVRAHANAYVLDVDRLAASFGRRYVQDDLFTGSNHGALLPTGIELENRMEESGRLDDVYECAPSAGFTQAIFAELRAMLRTVRGIDAVKLVVLDLDDTLWIGVSGEEADIGPHMVETWPIGLMEALYYLRKRGVLLAIASKNDEARVRAIFPKIFGIRLRIEDFALVRINWRSKRENMQEILAATNILPQNALFIDDNPLERAQMQAAFPRMRVLGGNPFLTRRLLLTAPELQVAHVSAESATRTEMVQQQVVRDTARASMDPETFAREHNVRVELRMIDQSLPKFRRAFELLNKTNQFNTTGRRWTEEQLGAFLADGGKLAAYEVEDRYTPYGLVGVVLVRGRELVQWVMSCRIIGLGVERAALHALVAHLRRTGAGPVTAMLEQTERNEPCQAFYRDASFVYDGTQWVLPEGALPEAPPHVTLNAELAS